MLLPHQEVNRIEEKEKQGERTWDVHILRPLSTPVLEQEVANFSVKGHAVPVLGSAFHSVSAVA